MDSSSTAWTPQEGQEWELRHDEDGFTYKILKRQRLDFSVPDPPAPDPEAEQKRTRIRKRNVLLKLKTRYQKEIQHWELLSNSLRAMEQRVNQQQLELRQRHQATDQTAAQGTDSRGLEEDPYGSLVDELLSKAEAQEGIIGNVSNLCDIADAVCDAHQERLVKSFLELPVWSSPQDLMASLCDE
ncbi:hypothetical protein LINPERPRIM_LOCUS14805 [Linum perenne]